MEFYDLPISKVEQDTENSVLINFELKNGLREKFVYKAGQYLTLEKVIDGKPVRRSYSMCSAPHEDKLTIAVKWIAGGLFSDEMKDSELEGEIISVGTPDGRFYVEPDSFRQRKHYFIAAGSGITPIMSMIKTILKKEPRSEVFLLYGNHDSDSTMLKPQIEKLLESYPERFNLEYRFSVINSPDAYHIPENTKVYQGRIDGDTIDLWLESNESNRAISEYYVCGPGEMIQGTLGHLESIGINDSAIHVEYFSVSKQQLRKKEVIQAEDGAFAPTDQAEVTVQLDGEEISLVIGQEVTILEAVEEAGFYPPFSCRSGTCSTCIAKCESGEVEMDVDLGLMPDEKEDGFILTCQSRVASKKIKINYDF